MFSLHIGVFLTILQLHYPMSESFKRMAQYAEEHGDPVEAKNLRRMGDYYLSTGRIPEYIGNPEFTRTLLQLDHNRVFSIKIPEFNKERSLDETVEEWAAERQISTQSLENTSVEYKANKLFVSPYTLSRHLIPSDLTAVNWYSGEKVTLLPHVPPKKELLLPWTIGRIVRGWRKNRNIGQALLGRQLPTENSGTMQRNTLNEYELGNREMTSDQVIAAAEHMRIPVQVIINFLLPEDFPSH